MDEFLIRRAATRFAAAPSACPPPDALAALIDARLSGGASNPDPLDAHIAQCEACTAVVVDAHLMQGPAQCPAIIELLRALVVESVPSIEAHLAACRGCAGVAETCRPHADEVKAFIDLYDAQAKLQTLGVAVSATVVLAALLARKATLGAAARGRVHRSRMSHLGTTSARPRLLRWSPFGRDEDTYIVVLTTDRGEIRVRTHEAKLDIDDVAWRQLAVEPGRAYRWGLTAMRGGRPVETQEGHVRFLSDSDAASLAVQEQSARQLPTDRAMLALSSLYRSWDLLWEACEVLRAYIQRHPDAPIGHLLLAEVCEDMDRVQEAARAMGQANRLLNAA